MQYEKKSIKSPKFSFTFDDKNINLANNTVTLLNSIFETNGSIQNYSTSPVAKIEFNGNFVSKDTAVLLSEYIKHPYKALGKLQTKGNIDFEQNKLKLKTQIKADKENYISYIVIQELLNKPSVTNIDIEAENGSVTIKDIWR